jgi:hypothetical protein
MTWQHENSTTTKHTHGPNFGRRVDGCPRCAELDEGAEPVSLAWVDNRRQTEQDDAERTAAIRAHFAAGGPHEGGLCGPVCTAFDW